ncbi:MAG: PPA1309 family protein [Jatrophihabitantaceae bacterium]
MDGLSQLADTIMLEGVAAEIEAFVGASGWSDPPTLFALVPTRLLAADPAAAAVLGSPNDGPDKIAADAITPIAQDELPDGPLDQALAQIGWPDEVVGCALSQQIVMLPPAAEAQLDDLAVESVATVTVEHPDRREARLVVAVLRDGRAASVLRLRAAAGTAEDLLTGADLAPNLTAALLATFDD